MELWRTPAEDSAALTLLRTAGSAVASALDADARPAEKMELAEARAAEALASTDVAAEPAAAVRELAERADWTSLLIEAAISVVWAEA